MVKVINKSSTSVAGVSGHVGFIGRQGEVALEADQGEILQGVPPVASMVTSVEFFQLNLKGL
jgi:hypothetical protein